MGVAHCRVVPLTREETSMAVTLNQWQAEHPGVLVDGDPAGRWLVYKPCLHRARRFGSYYTAHTLSNSWRNCNPTDGHSHAIVELAVPGRSGFSRSFRAMVDADD
jgi:hypothetical protein